MRSDPLPNYLKMYRKRSGLSERELAYLLGYKCGSRISRYENKRRRPSFETLLAYEVVFGLGLDALYSGEYRKKGAALRKRALRLHRLLDSEPFTPAIRRKLEFLAEIIYPPKYNKK